MAAATASTPGWMAAFGEELDEAWPDHEEQPEAEADDSNSREIGNADGALDFGSMVIRDASIKINSSSQQEYGTFINKAAATDDDQQQQIVWAAAALKSASKGDLLVEMAPKTPSRLQALFITPSPSATQQNQSTSVHNDVQDASETASPDAEEGLTAASNTDSLSSHISVPTPPLASAQASENTHVMPPTTEFSFHVAKQARQSWKTHLPAPSPALPNTGDTSANALATSTPTAAGKSCKRSSLVQPASAHKQSPSLGIFKFHHDAQTREYLEALVREIDGLSSPPRQGDTSQDRRQEDIEWLESLAALRMMPKAAQPSPSLANEDSEGRLCNTRSTKRVRLSVSDLRSPGPRVRPEGPVRLPPSMTPRLTRSMAPPRSHTRDRYPHSGPMSASRATPARRTPFSRAGQSSESPRRPPLRTLPPLSAGPSSSSYGNQVAQQARMAKSQPASRYESPSLDKLSKSQPLRQIQDRAVNDKLQQARALMERIGKRNNAKAQGIEEETRTPLTGEEGRHVGLGKPSATMDHASRPANPTPMMAAMGHNLLQAGKPSEQSESPEERKVPLQESSVAETAAPDVSTPEDERQDALAPLPQFTYSAASATIRQTLSQPSYHGTGSSLGSSSSFKRAFVAAPLGRNARPPARPASSFSSQSSSDRFFTSTSTRIPSAASTAATSLVGSLRNNEQAKTAALHASGLVHIAPEDAKELLTADLLGDMVFDHANQRWVKAVPSAPVVPVALQEDDAQYAAHQLSVIPEHEGSPIGNQESEDDPFRDITSIADSKSAESVSVSTDGVRHRRSGSLTFTIREEKSVVTASVTQGIEKTSTPPVASVNGSNLPLPSPDLPAITSQPSSSSTSATHQQRQSSQTATSHSVSNTDSNKSILASAPRSAMKPTRSESFFTPLPGNRTISGERKLSRSVSFSDGRMSGQIVMDPTPLSSRPLPRVQSSALRHQVAHAVEDSEQSESEDNTQNSIVEIQPAEEAEQAIDDRPRYAEDASLPVTSTISKSQTVQSLRTHNIVEALDELDRLGESGDCSSEQSTPTGFLPMTNRTRSIRTRARSASVVSGNSTLAWHRKPLNANATILTECSFGVSHDRLLQILTDVAPYEPDWKDLKQIDLHGRDVESAVRMKEFLPRLDEANLSNNSLSYLTGFPHTLRFLHLSHNKLSDLTSFSHIGNLETLNVSYNPRITSLVQLASLKHLRSLQAQACQIGTLDGIADLDGLLDLDISDNQLHTLQLEHTAWKRLESLNAHNNRICSVSGIEGLTSLKAINLDYNGLHTFAAADFAPDLRILKLSYNRLFSLDVSHMTGLRTIFADCNSISEVVGIERLKNLENLSLREQRQATLSLPVKDLRDLRRLFLSHNPLPSAFPTDRFMNLVLLELASSRLTQLPDDFSSLVPNCRVLVLDNNFLADLGVLSAMTRLRRLSVVGNRLEKVRGVVTMLSELQELELLDIRLNPATLGFYPPPLSSEAIETGKEASESYKAQDIRFRRSLPDEWLAKRTAYRALLIQAGPSLKVLDGLKVSARQRERVDDLMTMYTT